MSYYLLITLLLAAIIGLVGLGLIYLPITLSILKWRTKAKSALPKGTLLRQEPVLDKRSKPLEPMPVSPIPIIKDNTSDQGILSILYLMAPPNQPYIGDVLWETLIDQKLKYGPMKIFHAYEENTMNDNSVFSVANALEPGYFDINHIDQIRTPGLCLFMHYSTLENPLKTFENMLAFGKRLEYLLGGKLSDDQRRPLSESMIQRYRARLSLLLA